MKYKKPHENEEFLREGSFYFDEDSYILIDEEENTVFEGRKKKRALVFRKLRKQDMVVTRKWEIYVKGLVKW